MPTYEYLCRACGTRLEVVQSFSEDALTVCDDCGGELRKVFSAAGLIFKGSGWHIKDYSGSGSSSSGSGSSGSGSSGSGTATEKKSAGKDAAAAAPAPSTSSSSTSSSSGSSSSSSD